MRNPASSTSVLPHHAVPTTRWRYVGRFIAGGGKSEAGLKCERPSSASSDFVGGGRIVFLVPARASSGRSEGGSAWKSSKTERQRRSRYSAYLCPTFRRPATPGSR